MTHPDPPASRKRTKATSIDIAHHAGVSQATVSRVLRGSPLVNAETRRRVEEAVRELNYTVDRHASSLRLQRSGTLALLLFEDPTADDSHINPFFLSMLGSITRARAPGRTCWSRSSSCPTTGTPTTPTAGRPTV